MKRIETNQPETGAGQEKSLVELQILSADKVAERLGIGRARLRRWQKDGVVPSIKPPGGRKFLFIWEDVIEALRRHQRGGVV